MRLNLVKSKNTTQFYVLKSYRDKNGKNTSKIIEKLGNLEEVSLKANGQDPVEWARDYIKTLNKKDKEEKKDILVRFSPTTELNYNEQVLFNGGYLFLKKIYHELKLDEICKEITKKYKFKYDLNKILEDLIFARIMYPSSKLSTFEVANKFIEQPNYKLENVYRALSILSNENEYIQSELYNNSLNVAKRNTQILYYDCTNYYFEIEEADENGLRKYGKSKEHKPNPIVQMGLFMDANGLPLAFDLTPGNTNEQTTLIPLEQRILKDFDTANFIVCADAGLSSNQNKRFNTFDDRAFVVTQSIKKLKQPIQEWIFQTNDWIISDTNKKVNLTKILSTPELREKYYDSIFYKSIPFDEKIKDQKLIVTYSIKYHDYLSSIREKQIDRAKEMISNGCKNDKYNQNDAKRFIKKTNVTSDSVIAEHTYLSLDTSKIEEEKKYDGYYAVCTNLQDSPKDIIKINKNRWEIEECFRIMKHEFSARPVYVRNQDSIRAHFLTCYLALLVFRILEQKTENKYTVTQLISTLKDFNFYERLGDGYIPVYTRTEITDALHNKSNFKTHFEMITKKKMREIINITKK